MKKINNYTSSGDDRPPFEVFIQMNDVFFSSSNLRQHCFNRWAFVSPIIPGSLLTWLLSFYLFFLQSLLKFSDVLLFLLYKLFICHVCNTKILDILYIFNIFSVTICQAVFRQDVRLHSDLFLNFNRNFLTIPLKILKWTNDN